MTNDEKYSLLAEGDEKMASVMGILPCDKSKSFTSSYIEQSLKKYKGFKLLSFGPAEDDSEASANCESSYVAELEHNNAHYEINIYVVPTEYLEVEEYSFANHIDKESLQIAKEQKLYIETSMYFNDDNLASFHVQMKVMDAIVPDASVVVDFMSYRLLSAKWLHMSAESEVPPSPDYLYIIHCVYDTEGKKGEKRYWFHTHGLQRCGSVELEMVNITQGIEQMNTLINMTVKKFLSEPAREKQKFAIGYDGMGINLCWLRWEEALNDLPRKILGGIDDRKEGDIHAEPGGILFAVEDGNMISPEIYTKTLAENPVYYISHEETERMTALAKERFNIFKSLFDKENPWKKKHRSFFGNLLGSPKYDETKWAFLVKLGLTIDNAETESDKEHLWFEVLGINGDEMEVKLLNQPYWIASLKEGGIYKYPTHVLTDWLIYGPDSTYTTDSIYQLNLPQ